MSGWRLNWAFKQMLDFKSYRKHAEALNLPWRFWYALGRTLISGSQKGLTFSLKEGGFFSVHQFMTLFIYKEIFIDKCYDLPELSTRNPVIVDVGANTGLFTIRMKQLYPGATIHCFEPYHPNFLQLTSNVESSGFADVRLHPFGLGGNTRTEKLFIHDKNIGGHSILPQFEDRAYTQVELLSLKEAFSMCGISKCSLLKLDCEGAEYEIIKNIDAELAQRVDKIIFEPSYRADELSAHLAKLGFKLSENKGICIAVNENE
ncbi:MAG: putative family methyltransferase protein [Sphingobacteriaceae bacterium]|jgi:FkbM family methyltransferase|nr:putative family methyltransferase protein [Sphingobacteriaceae bacterium]